MRKKSKRDKQTSEELNSAHRCLQAKRQHKPVTLNKLNCLSLPYNKHLINQAKSVCMGES